MKLFKVLGLFYFFSIMVLGSILFGEHNCISSKLVQSIDIYHDKESVSFQACWSASVTQKTSYLGDLKTLKLINSSSYDFESYLMRNKWYMGSEQRWIVADQASVEESNREADKLSVNLKSVRLKPEDSRNLNLIRKKIVLNWINEFRRKYNKPEGVANEILSDIVAYIVWDMGLDNLEQLNFSNLVYSKKSICKSTWAPMDESDCRETNGVQAVSGQEEASNTLSEWSLRPMFLKAFKKKYSALSLKQKILFQKDLYTKIISFEVPKNLKFKLSTLEQVLARTDQIFWDGKKSEFHRVFKDLWFYADNKISSQSLVFNGQKFLNPETQSLFDFESFFIEKIHVNKELSLSEVSILNTEYVFMGKNRKIHVPSLKLAYSLDSKVFQARDPAMAVQKIIGWNPVLLTN